MQEQVIPTVEEVISHFKSLDLSAEQIKTMNAELFDRQYIFVTHGKEAIEEHKKYQKLHGRPIESNIKIKDRIGHCTRCHYEFVLPKEWRLSKNPFSNDDEKVCPYCGGSMWVTSGYTSRASKTLKIVLTYFELSIKDPNIIVAKSVAAVRSIEGDYRTCETIFYPVALYLFQKNGKCMMYKRDVHYDPFIHRFNAWTPYGLYEKTGPDHIGSPWSRQKSIGTRNDVWRRRGYASNWDKKSLEHVLQSEEFKYCGYQELTDSETWKTRSGEPFGTYLDDALGFLENYCRYPQIELLIKANMKNIVLDKILEKDITAPCIYWQAKNRKKFLRFKLTKEDKKYLRQKRCVTTQAFNVLAIATREGQHISLEEADTFQKESYFRVSMKTQGLPDIHKLMRYKEKQISRRGGQNRERIIFIHDYLDYIEDCKKLHYDLRDKDVSWPGDFYKAHEASSRTLRMKQQEEQREYMRVKALKEKDKAKKCLDRISKICQKFSFLKFETQEFFIRPAVSGDELIDEGAHNHSCVGSYIERYALGRTLVLLLRRKENPEDTFYTVEIDPETMKIIQCRTKHNNCAQPGSDVDKFICLYKETILAEANKRERVQVRTA